MARLKAIKLTNFNYKSPAGKCSVCEAEDKPVVEIAGIFLCAECSQGIVDIHSNMQLMVAKNS
jgi:hypothetical protein